MQGDAGRRVLVVDDSGGVRELLGVVLDAGGYVVAGAPHGRAALDLLEAFRPDVILLDAAMPVMDGREFARHYRLQPGPHAPVVLLTAEGDGLARAAEIGAAGFLSKPFNPPALLRLIDRLTGSERTERPLSGRRLPPRPLTDDRFRSKLSA